MSEHSGSQEARITSLIISGDKIERKATSALLSAFLSKSRINFADLTGQRPCPFEWRFFACAVRPTPPQKRRNGIACLCAITSSKYLLALAKCNFRIA